MKQFEMTPKMLSMGGAFYPTGYAVIMFPSEQDMRQVAEQLEKKSGTPDEVMHLTPETIIRHIGRADGESDMPLPSVGTEGHTVQRYVSLAREGHHALMVRAPDDDDMESVMEVVRSSPFSYGQKYHLLAIEDLE